MPRTDDTSKPIKEFKQKNYRPWNTIDELRPSFKNSVDQKQTEEKINNGTIGEQLGVNYGLIGEQKKINKGTIKGLIREQSGNTSTNSIGERKYNRGTIGEHIRGQLEVSLGNKNENLNGENIDFHYIQKLSGLQRKILFFIADSCISCGQLISPPLSNAAFRKITGASTETVKTTIKRLVRKNLLKRLSGRRGNGGHTVFEITHLIRQHIIEIKKLPSFDSDSISYNKGTIGEPIREQLGISLDVHKGANLPSSSSLEKLKTTTTQKNYEESTTLPPEWEEIDLSELHKRNVHFGKNQILSLWSFLKNYSVCEFQESVDSLVYDIDNKHVYARNGYLNLFIGIIRKGYLYLSSYYISPERQKMNEIINLSKKRQEEAERYRAAVENEKFHQWLSQYSEEEIKKQLPSEVWVDFDVKAERAFQWIKQNIYKKSLKV